MSNLEFIFIIRYEYSRNETTGEFISAFLLFPGTAGFLEYSCEGTGAADGGFSVSNCGYKCTIFNLTFSSAEHTSIPGVVGIADSESCENYRKMFSVIVANPEVHRYYLF
jgi:hypothetical protein